MTDEIDLRAAYYCVAEVLRHRRLSGAPIPAWLREHFDRLDTAIRCTSSSGHEPGCGGEQSEQGSWLTATQAAQALGVSARHVRRLAADLDGQLVGGRWLFPADAVSEYAEERRRR
ncbi:hypothetical protein JMUB5695_03117 [Mycobacterium heckeshornense]|uniref:helix-turn-helix domain-containing protein n=1 Tax=Mycobacterium heckeshornense TaxID=110505 RepID=UPI001941951A|nr:helix-turn-helix domain-containing protein [Mycobacterium heckeshornense]BCQ09667.1 hypothetical protein JMUB5695_03117 [Mycobacterium heckeshornense]